MFKVSRQEVEVEGKKIILETGKVARQADGAIIATCGETVVIATAVGAKKVNPDVDYFPLQVSYQEKYYAAGKIPGGYFKREARPTEAETLISRLIDRPIRPLFPEEFRNEVQVLPTVLSYDGVNEPDVLSIIACSAALAISGMPFQGPVGASRVGYIDDKYVLNPSKEEIEKSKLDLVVAGTKDAVLMVESEASGLSEKVMLDAVKFGHEKFVPVIEAIEKLVKDCGKEQWVVEKKDLSELEKKISDSFKKDLTKAFSIKDKQERSNLIGEITTKCKEMFEGDETYSDLDVSMTLKKVEKKIVRTDILKNKSRIDDVLELVELGEKKDQATLTYSGGMRKRLDIANGLLSRPAVLFLDEPTVGLDIQTRRKIWGYIKKIRKDFGMTVFISTHYMDDSDKLCDRIGIIDHGKIQVIDTPKSMKSTIGNEIISFNLVDGKANQDAIIDQIGKIEFVKEVKNKEGLITVFSTKSNEVIPKIFQESANLDMKIRSLTLKQPTLDDVFISYTGHDMRDETENKKYSRRKEFNLNRRKGL